MFKKLILILNISILFIEVSLHICYISNFFIKSVEGKADPRLA
jgi:hypothetical protein